MVLVLLVICATITVSYLWCVVNDTSSDQQDIQEMHVGAQGTTQVVYQQQAYVDDSSENVLYSSSGTQMLIFLLC